MGPGERGCYQGDDLIVGSVLDFVFGLMALGNSTAWEVLIKK